MAAKSQFETGVVAGVASVSDPSPLTTAALLREIEALKTLVFVRIDALEKAVDLAHDNFVRVPTGTDKAVGHLHALVFQRFAVSDERFANIHTQFAERDTRTEQTAKDTKTAVDAALQAAEKSVLQTNASFSLSIAKSEAATVKQIDALGLLIQTGNKATDDKIDEMRERQNRIEGEAYGQRSAAVDTRARNANSASLIGVVVGSLVGLLGVAMAIVSYFANRQ